MEDEGANKNKCEVLYLRRHNPGVQHRLGSTQLGTISVERHPEVLDQVIPWGLFHLYSVIKFSEEATGCCH